MDNLRLSLGLRAAGVVLAALLIAPPVPDARAQAPVSLGDQLRDLAAEEGVEMTGLELLDAEPPSQTERSGTLFRRLEGLLSGYNFILLHDSDGEIYGVRVLGRALKGPPEITHATVTAMRLPRTSP